MASLLSHPALPIAAYLSKKNGRFSKALLRYSIYLTLLPDADVIAFKFGIPYDSQWGHRGFTHSIIFALVIGLLSLPLARKFKSDRMTVFLMSFLAVLSHAILDAFTNGGLGVALFWPFDHARYFAPITPVEVSPIGLWGFLSFRGLVVVMSEILWIWLPFLILSAIVRKVTTRQA